MCVRAYIHSPKDIFKHIHSSTVWNSQTLHTAQTCINHTINNKLCSINKTEYYTATRTGNYNGTLQGWTSQIKWQVKEGKYKREHTVWFHTYKAEKQAKLICNFSSQNSGYPQKHSQQLERSKRHILERGVVHSAPLLDVGAGYRLGALCA